MSITTGSRSGIGSPKRPGLNDNDIQDMITTHVTMVVKESISEFFRFINTLMTEIFDERYAIVNEFAATGVQGRESCQY